jgi:hypothetical protein
LKHNFPENKRDEFSLEKIVLKRLTERRDRKNKMREMSQEEKEDTEFRMREYGQKIVYKKKKGGIEFEFEIQMKSKESVGILKGERSGVKR